MIIYFRFGKNDGKGSFWVALVLYNFYKGGGDSNNNIDA